jgi:hypothetical protein
MLLKQVVIRFSYLLQKLRRIFSKNTLKVLLIEACGVELVGDPIVLPDNNQASLSFLGTNYEQHKDITVIFILMNFSGRLVLMN